ncbi:unnamed protein product [Linum tenue]|uniref:Uncharacterized protein n=1 Tax=Linum tenue TaxID=586396 RepID=A0AAV0PP27_9ROSI|nr:unnamed protein product [Linum tenue]
MAFAVAETILKKLAPLVVEQAGLLWGLKSEVLKLKSTVTSIHAVLLDAEEQSGVNHQVQVWLDELKQVLYDADDLLDDFNTETLLKQQRMDLHGNLCKNEVCIFFSSYNPLLNGLLMAYRSKVEDLQLQTLKSNLKKQMDNKRFLLVLDDVWDNGDYESNWDRLMSFLCNVGTVGSKIIITTRIGSVASLMATKGLKPHELKGLSKQDSWSLFEQITFKGEVLEGGERFKRMGEEIVGRCVGVPLAIRAMAGVLASKRDLVDWEALRDKQARLDGVGSDKRISATLRLSYDNLPSYLKPCFAYCSLFPKDYEITVRTLVQLWMGQGYIDCSQSPSSNLYDTGVEYFKSMLSKSFFQETSVDNLGDLVVCKMHDLIHDLALEVAGKENFTLKASTSMVYDDVNFDRLLHLSFDFEEIQRVSLQVPDSLLKQTKLRTFLPTNLHWQGMSTQGGTQYESIFSNMTSLRVLSFCNAGMKIVPPSIHYLKRLRFLDLSYNNGMEMLPNEITRLVNLQVLILDFCEELRELPNDIVKLSYLECLSLIGCDALRHLPSGIKKLTRLKELSSFILALSESGAAAATAKISELKDLNLSGSLAITNLQSVEKDEAEAASLKRKQNL